MFTILDAADGNLNSNRPKTSADRACDQCKSRKVRCDMTKPCLTCAAKGFTCTYDRARKKRGPAGKRISEIQLHQRSMSTGDHEVVRPLQSPPMSDLFRVSTAQFDSKGHPAENGYTNDSMPWSATTPSQGSVGYSPRGFADVDYQQQQAGAPRSAPSEHSGRASTGDGMMTSPNGFIFPSLPAESPSGTADPFVAILEQELPPLAEAADVWPAKVNETTLLPWIDVYFKRLHPTIPILNRTNIYSDMLLRKHRIEPQYGAMLLSMCAFAMTQPVQIHERASMPSRSVQARMLMEECVKMRVAADFGENPTMEMILTSFFLFACLFGNNQHKAARHRLREAVDLAYSLRLHLPESYNGLTPEAKEQWLRTYLVLSVTERAYALQQNHAISFRGQPGITARFMQAFDPNVTSEYIASLIFQDQSDSVGMTGLLYLMDTFDAIDESVTDCWNGFCRFSDGSCETFDRRRALQMFRAQRRAREACISGNILFAPTVNPLPLLQLLESQQADISVTQFWTLNRLWNLCLSHQLLREQSDHWELRLEFACHIAHALLSYCQKLALASMEVHGVGIMEKVFDMAMGVIVAMNTSASLHLDLAITPIENDVIPGSFVPAGSEITIRQLLDGLSRLMGDFRGGDHPYNARFTAALQALQGV
ncbi:hypothetical protein CKM354_001244700 [Cercospora kikuchii]|uniref:Zn(2)-C6 fungal-type domain-containing protein n=1 Tax=Cercospora kikuchii TaxID=84275 RepID=A0A9P3FM06_9PEZI|nr:uncharacterized protein CKM354_001244700 [Cercospora kikuchii]GIZ49417.1 hypothetical protein CKM354_001244700 [Cercospora kikuchii]